MAYSEVILSTYAFVDKAEITQPLHSLRSLFTVKSKFEDRSIEAYKETKGFFGFPLFYHKDMEKFADRVVDKRVHGTPVEFRMSDGFQLRENQQPVFDDFCNRLQNGMTGFLLEASTGFGKTVCAVRMLCELGVTALVIVPRDFLVRQWVDALISLTDLTTDDIGIAQQGVCTFQGKKVVIGMIHSLAKDRYPSEFKRYFGAVVWDEVHVVGADTFSRTVGMFPSHYRIGMSATPNRKDGMQDVFRLSIMQCYLSPDSLKTLVSPKVFLRSYRTVTKHPYLERVKDAKARRGKLLSEVAADLSRNALIALYAKKFADSDRRVLVLSDRIEQLKFLRDVLTKRYGMRYGDVGLFTGQTKEGDRKIILKNSKLILGTYGVLNMGVDVPDLRALIFATPLSDAAQSVGRVLRLCSGVKEPVVLDIVDVVYDDCVRWAKERQKYYRNTARAKIFAVE
jgi:superfamily II DNA or RNA helicase